MSQSSSEWWNEWIDDQLQNPDEVRNAMQSPASIIDLEFLNDITTENAELGGKYKYTFYMYVKLNCYKNIHSIVYLSSVIHMKANVVYIIVTDNVSMSPQVNDEAEPTPSTSRSEVTTRECFICIIQSYNFTN